MSRKFKKEKQAGRRAAREWAKKHFKDFESHLKPKPKWVPEKVWRWGMKIFIKL